MRTVDRILVIDDDVELCSLVSEYLQPEGFQVESVHDGERGLERALSGDHLLIVDRKSARYIDCKSLALPFGPQFVRDIVNRTELAQNQAAALLATELVLKGQKNARML